MKNCSKLQLKSGLPNVQSLDIYFTLPAIKNRTDKLKCHLPLVRSYIYLVKGEFDFKVKK